MATAKRKPNWTLCVREGDGDRGKWRNIGAAWDTEKGNLFVKLDEGEALRGTAMLFPYREKPGGGGSFRRGTMDYHRPAPKEPAYSQEEAKRRAGPPIAQPATPTTDLDYMDRKRQERLGKPTVPTVPLNHDDDCPDPEAPDWL